METVNVTVRMERQTRDEAAKLFSELGISTTQATNMFLKQAAREQGIPFEATTRTAVERGGESMEKQRTAHRVGRRSALTARQPPDRGCMLLIGQKYSKCAILSAWLKSTTYTRR